MFRGFAGASRLKATTSAITGTPMSMMVRMVSSLMVLSSSAPKNDPGSAPATPSSAGHRSRRWPLPKRSVATSVPKQAESLLVPAASVGGNPAR